MYIITINYIEGNEGFNFQNLKHSYRLDKSKTSFKKWFIGYLTKTEGLSRYVANRVANHYNV